MKGYFTIGEIAKQQNISRQTLIFYDKIGLFHPSYIDEENGYRYYSAKQLDYLDTICIMKKIGFSLEEIKDFMKGYTIEDTITALNRQLASIEEKIKELVMIKSRIDHRLKQLESVLSIGDDSKVMIGEVKEEYLLIEEVAPPYTMEEISLATKKCFTRSFKEHLPIYFQSGVIVPYEKIVSEKYIEASYAFLPIEKRDLFDKIIRLNKGKCVYTYHRGDYYSIGRSYQKILSYCEKHDLKIISDSYEFAINDYLSTDNEDEYVTKIMFYIA